MAGYIGTQPVPQATQTRDAFTSTNNQTSFPTSGYTPEFLDVFLNGVKLAAADYTATNGSDVVLAVGATTGDILEVVSYGTFEVLNPTFDGNVTFTGNASFGDNDKAIFGDGNDLQIYHDGSNSYVKDNGTGDLYLQGTANVRITNTSGQKMFLGQDGGEAQLYYSGLEKLATTSTGIDVTGTVNAVQLDITAGTDAKIYTSNAISEVGTGNFAIQSVNSAGSALKPLGFRAEDIRFATGSSERMRIDSSGNVLVGTTNSRPDNFTSGSGTAISEAGIIRVARGGDTLVLNRVGSDGTITTFRKDGTTVGSIGVVSAQPYFVSGNTGIRLSNTNNGIFPAESDGTNRDAAIDLGASTSRFKDLYLSGGVYLGGTGAANKLDDYETGTWTPALNNAPSGISNVGTTTHNNYTKIGNLVFVTGYIQLNTGSSSGNSILIEGLPFNPTSTNAIAGSLIVRYGSSDTYTPYMGNNSRIEFYKLNNTGNWNLMTYSNVGNPFSVHFTISYQT